MSPQRTSYISITMTPSSLIVDWTMQPQPRYSLNRQPQFRLRLLNHPIPMPGVVAMLISLATIESLLTFLFREVLLCHSKSRSAAQRTLDAAARMARRTEELLFPPPVGAGIHSRGVKGARPAHIERTFSLSTRRTFSLSSDMKRTEVNIMGGSL